MSFIFLYISIMNAPNYRNMTPERLLQIPQNQVEWYSPDALLKMIQFRIAEIEWRLWATKVVRESKTHEQTYLAVRIVNEKIEAEDKKRMLAQEQTAQKEEDLRNAVQDTEKETNARLAFLNLLYSSETKRKEFVDAVVFPSAIELSGGSAIRDNSISISDISTDNIDPEYPEVMPSVLRITFSFENGDTLLFEIELQFRDLPEGTFDLLSYWDSRYSIKLTSEISDMIRSSILAEEVDYTKLIAADTIIFDGWEYVYRDRTKSSESPGVISRAVVDDELQSFLQKINKLNIDIDRFDTLRSDDQ